MKKKINQDSRLNLVISSSLKSEIEKKAQTMGLSLSAYIRLVLAESVSK